MEGEVVYPSLLAGAHEPLFDIVDSRLSTDAAEDVLYSDRVISKQLEDSANSLTHRNSTRSPVLALFDQEPAGMRQRLAPQVSSARRPVALG